MLSKNTNQCYQCAKKGVIRLAKHVRKIGSIYNGTAFDIGLCDEHLAELNRNDKIREKGKATTEPVRAIANSENENAEHQNSENG